jgi:hypothetical protein
MHCSARLLWVLVVMSVAASVCLGQRGSMSMSMSLLHEASFHPDISQRDLRVIIRVLGLKGDSLQALQDLYDGYVGTLASEGAEVREFVAGEVERAETLNDVNLLSDAHTRIHAWTKRSEQIKKNFLEDLKSLLTRDEEARWPIVERELRRIRYIHDGVLSGENVDLVNITGDLLGDTEVSPELAALLNRYSEELDRALVARRAAWDENYGEYTKALTEDPTKARRCWEAMNEARLAVRAVNDRYARLLAAEVPPELRERFERMCFERTYRALCRPSSVEEYINAARQLNSLSAEQVTRLEEIAAAYEARLWVYRQSAAKAWRQFEEDCRKESLEQALRGEQAQDDTSPRGQQYNGAWLPESHPINVSRRERYELDVQFRKHVEAVLTAAQRAEVRAHSRQYARFENWEPADF